MIGTVRLARVAAAIVHFLCDDALYDASCGLVWPCGLGGAGGRKSKKLDLYSDPREEEARKAAEAAAAAGSSGAGVGNSVGSVCILKWEGRVPLFGLYLQYACVFFPPFT